MSEMKTLRQLLELEELKLAEKLLKKEEKKDDPHHCIFCAMKKIKKEGRGYNPVKVWAVMLLLFPFVGKAYVDLLQWIWTNALK